MAKRQRGAAGGYTGAMASRHPRVQVPVDAEVADAIERGRRIAGRDAPASQVLRALALRGAAAIESDVRAEAAARDFLVSVARGTSGLDLDGLRTARDRAWR
jgi:hypothetical protein